MLPEFKCEAIYDPQILAKHSGASENSAAKSTNCQQSFMRTFFLKYFLAFFKRFNKAKS